MYVSVLYKLWLRHSVGSSDSSTTDRATTESQSQSVGTIVYNIYADHDVTGLLENLDGYLKAATLSLSDKLPADPDVSGLLENLI